MLFKTTRDYIYTMIRRLATGFAIDLLNLATFYLLGNFLEFVVESAKLPASVAATKLKYITDKLPKLH